MKKIILFIVSGIIINTLNAQITISAVDMPLVNDTFRWSETNNIQGLDPALTGTHFSWDFSALEPRNQRIDTFFALSSSPIAYQIFFNNVFLYPNHKASYALKGADIGITQVPISAVFNYHKNSSSAFDNVGFGSTINGMPNSTQNNPVDREYTFPMNYLNHHTAKSAFAISVPTFGYYGQTLERIDTIDGCGILKLPNGAYDVLRVKSILKKVDTIYVDFLGVGTTISRPEEIEYKWLANGKGVAAIKSNYQCRSCNSNRISR